VGNSPNAAVAAARLGLTAALITNLGEDEQGHEALAALKKNGVDTQYIKAYPDIKTNYHYVLWYADDRTILIKHEEYPYPLPDIGSPAWIYLSSLGEHSLPLHDKIADYLEARPEIKLAFQPGTYQIKFGKEKLARIYKRSDLFFCNTAEARKILNTEEEEVKVLLKKLHERGPKTVMLTAGRAGAYAFDGTSCWFMPAYPDPQPPFERTGAGDAFSSTVTAALALGKPFLEAFTWGPINSMSVVQKIGAQEGLLTRAELEKYLAEAPADYKPRLV
jgi:sugar/nucleoside kinase (ribokinase family)